jgi:hypothetical protein
LVATFLAGAVAAVVSLDDVVVVVDVTVVLRLILVAGFFVGVVESDVSIDGLHRKAGTLRGSAE